MNSSRKIVRVSSTNRSVLLAVIVASCVVVTGPSCLAAKLEPTLSYIAADEPIHVAGFPPLPDSIDLPGFVASKPAVTNPHITHGCFGLRKNSAGIVQLPAGAFIPNGNQRYKFATENAASNQDSALKSLGQEPSLDSRRDQAIPAEAPLPVAVNQSKTQDLSLPDDAFDIAGSNKRKNSSAVGNAVKQAGQQMLNPIRNAGSMGSGLMNRAIRF